jgi:pSer/pThr/pTyr-binding forkhead associated (FHA) protein
MHATSQAREFGLRVDSGHRVGAMIRVSGPSFVIGRAEGCQLRPASQHVSRRHAEIVVKDEAMILRDLGSRNGTLLNGEKITGAVPLDDGDRIEIGPLAFVATISEPAPDVEPREADELFSEEIPVTDATQAEEGPEEDEYVFESAAPPAKGAGGAAPQEDASFDDVIASFLSERTA